MEYHQSEVEKMAFIYEWLSKWYPWIIAEAKNAYFETISEGINANDQQPAPDPRSDHGTRTYPGGSVWAQDAGYGHGRTD